MSHLDVGLDEEPPDGLKDAAGQEEVVEDGQTDEQSVEDARKLLGQQQREDHGPVREESSQADHNLEKRLVVFWFLFLFVSLVIFMTFFWTQILLVVK